MFRHALSFAVPVSLAFLLSACGQEEATQVSIRPAMVVQPEPSAQAMESYPGEVRARYEPDLAFRIGGKVSRRLVEEGQRVKADQPLAELDPQDVRLQLEATRAQVAAAEANLNLVRAERDRYKTLMERQMLVVRPTTTRKTSIVPAKRVSSRSRPNSTSRPTRPVTRCCARRIRRHCRRIAASWVAAIFPPPIGGWQAVVWRRSTGRCRRWHRFSLPGLERSTGCPHPHKFRRLAAYCCRGGTVYELGTPLAVEIAEC